MRLSDNFKLSEFTTSQTAIRHDIHNAPTHKVISNLILLCKHVLQPLRNDKGSVHISSGFRSVELNKKIGGANNSQHTRGQAADINTANNAEAFHYIKNNLDFDQLIWEFGSDTQPAWVHVSYSDKGNRKEISRADRIESKTIYTRL